METWLVRLRDFCSFSLKEQRYSSFRFILVNISIAVLITKFPLFLVSPVLWDIITIHSIQTLSFVVVVVGLVAWCFFSLLFLCHIWYSMSVFSWLIFAWPVSCFSSAFSTVFYCTVDTSMVWTFRPMDLEWVKLSCIKMVLPECTFNVWTPYNRKSLNFRTVVYHKGNLY